MTTGFARAAAAAVFALIALPQTAPAEGLSGAYLAGRQALIMNDFAAAADHYARALETDTTNDYLLESTIISLLSLGEARKALPYANILQSAGGDRPLARLTILADKAQAGDWDGVLEIAATAPDTDPITGSLVAGWALVGKGDRDGAMARFDAVGEDPGLKVLALYHKALALAALGDFEAAEAIFDEEDRSLFRTRRGAMARAEILSQLGRNDEALERLADAFRSGFDPGLTEMADRLASGETIPFDTVADAKEGLAELHFTLSLMLDSEDTVLLSLIQSRLAGYLRPDHVDAILMSAEMLEGLEQYDLAVETYRKVSKDSPDFYAAEQGRAEALGRAGKPDAAIEVLERLSKDYPTLPSVYASLGDFYRTEGRFAEAAGAYDRALEYLEEDSGRRWAYLYARGIARERLQRWDDAEADFRLALDLQPGHPMVLNYLGYSLVEKQQNLDEALAMIEEAVATRPDNGYIVDSLGWALYRLGRYEEAVAHMERAVALEAVDPVINDHLGDVYWAVGRKREAEFQWKRALSFVDPTEEGSEADPDRMRRKLAIGLDATLAEEGSPPLKVADGKN
ncbi:tetratricopeptide repeat protein [Chachezhania sediminis]|uniref:tetratricopeptide repeat protein n=1 Tax=Chachezhania sediminis TaxID=2599291 RepID=UPI00131C0C47|nr:tetratricopeptide repeat protein [Chachezhania sediminis]